MNSLAGVVVLYNPSDSVKNNIDSYLEQVDQLYLVDNSLINNNQLFADIINDKKVIYIHQGKNMGIAHALNIGCNEAIKHGYEWILTMDQDSKFVELAPNLLSNCLNNTALGITLFFPDYLINEETYDKLFKYKGKSFIAMTSGNILNLNVYNEVGGFNEKLFIDYVDIDYCLKLAQANYSIKKIDGITLLHGLGKVAHKSLLGKKLIITNHNYIRRYYITRNRFFIINEYKKQFPFFIYKERQLFFTDLLKILLFESDKIKKLRSIIKGYFDYKKGRYGEYKFR